MQWVTIGIQIASFLVSAITTLWPMFQGGSPDMGHIGMTTGLGALAAHNLMYSRRGNGNVT